RVAVQRDPLADDRAIGRKAPLPERMTDHDGARTVPNTLLGREVAAEHGMHAEQRKEVLRDGNGAEANRFRTFAQRDVAVTVERRVGRDVGERSILPLEREEWIDLERLRRESGLRAVLNPHESIGIRE